MHADIWDYDDEFHYFYQSAIGDVSIEIFVNSFTLTGNIGTINDWAKGGLMFRDSLDANSKHISLFVTGSNGLSNHYTGAPKMEVRQAITPTIAYQIAIFG